MALKTRLRIKSLLEQQASIMNEYETRLESMEAARSEQQRAYADDVEHLKKELARKISPHDHQEQIAALKHVVIGKEQECRRVNSQVQECKLELQNNEQIFNKFFLNPHSNGPSIHLHPPSSPRSFSKGSARGESTGQVPNIPRTRRRRSHCVTAIHEVPAPLPLATAKSWVENC